MKPNNDPLWEVAKQRAKFKKSLTSYIIVIPFLWLIWFFSSGRYGRHYDYDNLNYFSYHLPWPVWVMFLWGICLVFAYLKAYHGNNVFSTEKEYEKLKNNNK